MRVCVCKCVSMYVNAYVLVLDTDVFVDVSVWPCALVEAKKLDSVLISVRGITVELNPKLDYLAEQSELLMAGVDDIGTALIHMEKRLLDHMHTCECRQRGAQLCVVLR